MNEMKKKHYIIIIALLVILNIFSWRIWWETPKRAEVINSEQVERERRSRGDGGGMNFFEQRLKLSSQQKQEFSNLKQAYFSEVEMVKDSMNQVRKNLVGSIGSQMDQESRNSLFGEMAKHKLKIERLTIEHFNSLRSLCSEEQKPVFDTIMVRMLDHSPMFKESGRSQEKHRWGDGKGKGRHNRQE